MRMLVRTGFLRYGLVAGGLVLGSLLGGGTSRAEDPSALPSSGTPPSTAEVLGNLHQADVKEVQAGKIAQKNGQSRAVRDYGAMLVKDHTAGDKKVAALATQENIDLRAATPAPGANDMGTMASGPDFDKKFAQEMLDDHRRDLTAVTAARNATADPELKKLLGDTIPTLEKHEAAAQKIIDSEATK
jgi:putative membrane protein